MMDLLGSFWVVFELSMMFDCYVRERAGGWGQEG